MKKKWAICGLGKIADRFFEVAKLIDEIDIVAVASSDKARAIEWGKRHNINSAYTYEELFDADIEACYVSTNNHLHHFVVMGLLNKKIAVLCEKPFAINSAQSNEMLSSAKNNDVLIMEAMWTKFLPCNIEVRNIVSSGKYGNLKAIDGAFCTSMLQDPSHRIFHENVGGGSLLDLGVYPISYIYALLGKPNSIKAIAEFKNNVDMTTRLELYYKDVTATAKCSCISENRDSHMFIDMERARIEILDFQGANQYTLIVDGEKTLYEFGDKDGFYYEMKHFCELLDKGARESDIQKHIDTKNVMDILTDASHQIGLKFKFAD